VGVQIELDKTRSGKISKNWPGRHSKDGGELRQRHRLHSTQEVECRTPHSGDLAKANKYGEQLQRNGS
jgi:hypothetical protein